MDKQMQPWGQFLAFVSQLGKSASTAQSKWSEMPLLNVSSIYFSCPLHLPSVRSFWMGVHTSYLLTQTHGPPSLFQPMLRSLQSIATLPALTRRILIVDESGISRGDIHHYIASPLFSQIGSNFSSLLSLQMTQ